MPRRSGGKSFDRKGEGKFKFRAFASIIMFDISGAAAAAETIERQVAVALTSMRLVVDMSIHKPFGVIDNDCLASLSLSLSPSPWLLFIYTQRQRRKQAKNYYSRSFYKCEPSPCLHLVYAGPCSACAFAEKRLEEQYKFVSLSPLARFILTFD